MSGVENREISILKALGIIGILLLHKHVPVPPFIDPAFYVIQIFLFVSGYLSQAVTASSYIPYLFKKIQRNLVPYFLYNAFYAFLTVLIFRRYHVVLGELPTWQNFFLAPFLHGHQYALFNPAWFVPYLFLIQATFPIVKSLLSRFFPPLVVLLAFFVLAGLSVEAGTFSPNLFIVLMGKVGLGYYFFALGQSYRASQLEQVDRFFSSQMLFIVLIVQSGLLLLFPQSYNIFSSLRISVPSFAYPLLSTCALYLFLFLARALRSLPQLEGLLELGRQSYTIMANHYLVFFLINIALLNLFSVPNEGWGKLTDPTYAYQEATFWPLFVVLGLAMPVFVSQGLHLFHAILLNWKDERKNVSATSTTSRKSWYL